MNSIPRSLRLHIEHAAKQRCGYCLTQAVAIGMPLELDHLIPLSRGGTSTEENLWLACPQCNRYKAAQVEFSDPESGQMVALFNPRIQRWQEHFAWQQNGLYVVGISPIGRATVVALQMNNPWIVRARKVWIAVRIHPPMD